MRKLLIAALLVSSPVFAEDIEHEQIQWYALEILKSRKCHKVCQHAIRIVIFTLLTPEQQAEIED